MKIKFPQIFLFVLFFCAAISGTTLTAAFFSDFVMANDFRVLILVLAGVFFFYVYSIVLMRLFQLFFPVPTGLLTDGTKGGFAYQIGLLFYLIIFLPLLRTPLPTPLVRIIYLALGARLGKNTYCSGLIMDPHFVKVGDNTLIGMDSLIVPHIIENQRVAHYPITIGHGVTIGAHAIIQAGSTIGDNAIVAMGSVVRKNTMIKAGEVWGGIPARFLKNYEE